MNDIEMTDVDGDALTLISRDHRTWITCTSGTDEVTVGPFPSRLLRTALLRPAGDGGSASTTLISHPSPTPATEALAGQATEAQGRADATGAPDVEADAPASPGERAWAEFQRLAETAPLREAVAGAADAALAAPALREARDLAEELRTAAIDPSDPDALAALLLSLGYRRD
ncbi:hypothetical protein [Brachybacterium saurashtrense]|uniref:Uncharacterized protein n=1 Tax=Brachybacterium saurashtrense TaxID=556288 RepID=A0A345YQM2_9MICO|nr:hypothetical protein [Brachybacterium saurashtrense]AXK46224.1 hypothetical protein DWV08_11800 [Brachybacterium saurashtrense]RRR23964.1 hypothetical protein DXU92_03550 [Brachybacterium saurashtrense]